MLRIVGQICHIDNCPHGCTTHCEGHAWKLVAPAHYHQRMIELIDKAAADGVDLIAKFAPQEKADAARYRQIRNHDGTLSSGRYCILRIGDVDENHRVLTFEDADKAIDEVIKGKLSDA